MLLCLMISISVLILSVIYYIQKKREGFLDLNKLENPLIINNECKWKTDDCNTNIPLIPASCNRVPNYPNGLEPKATSLNITEYHEVPFNRLAPKNGEYTFVIPELKYDGIYSRQMDNDNKCCWTLTPNKPETYGTNNYLHIPNNSMYNKTIIDPPECAGYPTGYPPKIYLNDCEENIPCSISYKLEL